MMENEQIEEMASAVRERTVVCNKCEYYKEGSCLKPVDLGCNDNEDILNLCDAIYENNYRKASEVAREIFSELEATFHGDGFHYFVAMPVFDILKKKYGGNQ